MTPQATVPLTIILREWCKSAFLGTPQGPWLLGSALIRENHEMQHRSALHLESETPQEACGVNVCVVKSTHVDDHLFVRSTSPLPSHHANAEKPMQNSDDAGAKNTQLGSFSEI